MTSRAAKPRPMPARMARQTAGCRNERPLFRDCSLQRKYQLRRVEAQTTCSERYGAMAVRGANRRANSQPTRPDHQFLAGAANSLLLPGVASSGESAAGGQLTYSRTE